MSIVGDQVAEPVSAERIGLLVANLGHKLNARLREAHCRFIPDSVTTPPPYSLQLNPRLGVRREQGGFVAGLPVSVTLASSATPGQAFWECSLTYEFFYELPDLEHFSDLEILQFAQSSSFLAMWPYVREVVHSLAGRSGLNGVVLPVVRAGDFAPSGSRIVNTDD